VNVTSVRRCINSKSNNAQTEQAFQPKAERLFSGKIADKGHDLRLKRSKTWFQQSKEL
jgi:hypothetical protein